MLWTMILILWLWQKRGCDLEIHMMLKWELCVLLAIGSYMFQDLIPGEGVGVLFKDNLNINFSMCDTFQSFEFMDVRLRRSVLGSCLFIVHLTTTPVCSSLKSSLDY